MTVRSWLRVMVCGCVALPSWGCTASTPVDNTDYSGLTGDATAGQTRFNQSCAACHNATTLASHADAIRTDLASLNPAMSGIALTAQQVVDLRAYLATK